MCTVSYINNNGRRYFTSNRDENQSRPAPLQLECLRVNGMSVTFPKDPLAGGTWFAVSNKPGVAILLNGAFEKHIPCYPYKKSRGLVLLDLISAPDFKTAFSLTILKDIEPFTIVYAEKEELVEFIWDGSKKHLRQLDTLGSYIWSSVTLYDNDAITRRRSWFHQYLNNTNTIDGSTILNLHSNNHNDPENGFVIQRKNGIGTQSITQAILQDENIWLTYYDLKNKTQIKRSITNNETINESD